MTLHRRSFITGLVSLVAAPAIVRAGSLMPVKVMIEPYGIGPMMTAVRDFSGFPPMTYNRFGQVTITSWLDAMAWMQKQKRPFMPVSATFADLLKESTGR